MISNMPKYAQAPVKNYLETGKFKDHTPDPIPADEVASATEELQMLALGVMSQDNTEVDSNPKEGVIDAHDSFFGDTHIEFENIGEDATKVHGFGTLGTNEEGATAYVRQTPEAMDFIIVGAGEHVEEGVIHLDQVDASKSFMTMSPEDLGLFS
jgi:hypothetical protein